MAAWPTRNASFRLALAVAEQAARCGQHALLRGEPGSGRQRLAWQIHAESGKAAGLFVPVNCAAVPIGFAPPANATLFLSGFGEAPLPLQAELVSAADQVGALVIATASPDTGPLQSLPGALIITLPALRERRDDLELLTHELLSELAGTVQAPPAFTAEAIAAILLHPWPGNVSELKRALRRALRLAGTGPVDLHHLPQEVAQTLQPAPPRQLFKRYLRSAELFLIRWALGACSNDRTRAARFLGLSRAALYKKLKLYPEFRTEP